MLGDFVVIYSTEASNMHVTILENSINCSDISRDTETEPITAITPKLLRSKISLPFWNIFVCLIMAALLQSLFNGKIVSVHETEFSFSVVLKKW